MTKALTMTVPEPMRGQRRTDFMFVIEVAFPLGAAHGHGAKPPRAVKTHAIAFAPWKHASIAKD